MNPKCEQLFTKAKPQTRIGKIIQFPLTRIILALLFIAPVSVIANLAAIYITEPLGKPYSTILSNVTAVIYFFLFLYAYRLYTKYIEKREAYEISRKNSIRELGLGLVIGIGLVSVIVTLLAVLGFYRVENFNSWIIIIEAFFLFGIGAFIQELVIRGILFRIVEEVLGSWITIIIVSCIFGLIHTLNENATLLSIISLIVSDILLMAAFIYTRKIWMVWGIHFGWNFFQDGIFGMPNSGITQLPSWINPIISGPEWITGGSWGIEASYISILLLVTVGIVILKKAMNNDLIVKSYWKRKEQ